MSSDEAWRELEQAWAASPGDPELLEALVRALVRAGQPVPSSLQDERRFPGRPLGAIPDGVVLWVLDEEGESDRVEPDAELDPHRGLWAEHVADPETWPAVRDALRELRPTGLLLDARRLPRQLLDVGRLEFLRELVLFLPSSTYLEHDAPGRRYGRGEGASLRFLLGLSDLRRLEHCLEGDWLAREFLGTSLVVEESEGPRGWPVLNRLRLDRFLPGEVLGTEGYTNVGRPSLAALATLPSLEQLELRGWIFDREDLAALRDARALRSVRVESPGLREPAPELPGVEVLGEDDAQED